MVLHCWDVLIFTTCFSRLKGRHSPHTQEISDMGLEIIHSLNCLNSLKRALWQELKLESLGIYSACNFNFIMTDACLQAELEESKAKIW